MNVIKTVLSFPVAILNGISSSNPLMMVLGMQVGFVMSPIILIICLISVLHYPKLMYYLGGSIWRNVGILSIVLLSAFTSLTIRHFGWLSFDQYVRKIKFSKLRLTLHGEDVAVCEERCTWFNETFYGSGLEQFVARNKILAASAQHKLAFASPTRPIPVLADLERLGDIFWTLENDRAVRYRMVGYPEVRVKVLPPESVNKRLANDVARWQELRGRVASSFHKGDMVKKIRMYTAIFSIPNIDNDRNFEAVELWFFHTPLRQRKLQPPQANIAQVKWMNIDQVEHYFEPFLQKATEAEAAVAALKRAVITPPVSHAQGSSPSLINAESDKMVERDDVGLCVSCLDARAELVMQSCGHLVYCTRCRRQLVGLKKGIVNHNSLAVKVIEQTVVPCPICRAASYMVRSRGYKQTMYKQ